jgi:hypothetical protein
MKLAQLRQEIHALGGDLPRPASVEQALAALRALGALPGPESRAVQRVLRHLALATPKSDLHVTLDGLGPLALPPLARLLEAIIDEGYRLRP